MLLCYTCNKHHYCVSFRLVAPLCIEDQHPELVLVLESVNGYAHVLYVHILVSAVRGIIEHKPALRTNNQKGFEPIVGV